MNIVIIEDEPLAASRLKSIIGKVSPAMQVSVILDSVKSAANWFTEHEQPQLIFMDVQLADGISFEIFEKVEIKAPVIFTTAYDEYAIKAFKVNSIDYLLKPIDENELTLAITKFEKISKNIPNQQEVLSRIGSAVQMLAKKYKERFVTKVGEHLKFIGVGDILYFYSADKVTFCKTKDSRKHILDFSMDQLEHLIDPSQFYRINRKYLISVASIADMISYTNSRLKLILKSCDDADVIVARERVQDFKNWLDS